MAGAERATARSVTAPRLGSIALLGLFFIFELPAKLLHAFDTGSDFPL